jgi:hypothetical protein
LTIANVWEDEVAAAHLGADENAPNSSTGPQASRHEARLEADGRMFRSAGIRTPDESAEREARVGVIACPLRPRNAADQPECRRQVARDSLVQAPFDEDSADW